MAGEMLFPFIEREYLALCGRTPDEMTGYRSVHRLARLSLLFSFGAVVIPAPGMFETAMGRHLTYEFVPAIERGLIVLSGSTPSPESFVDRKANQYPGELGRIFQSVPRSQIDLVRQSWRAKRSATDEDLKQHWKRSVESERNPLLALTSRSRDRIDQSRLHALPSDLDGRAIIASNLVALLPRKVRTEVSSYQELGLRLFLAAGFYESYAHGLSVCVLSGPGGPDIDALMPRGMERISPSSLVRMLRAVDLDRRLLVDLSVDELVHVVDSAPWRAFASAVRARIAEGLEWTAEDIVAFGRRPGRWGVKAVGRLPREIDGLLSALSKIERSRRRHGDINFNGDARIERVVQVNTEN